MIRPFAILSIVAALPLVSADPSPFAVTVEIELQLDSAGQDKIPHEFHEGYVKEFNKCINEKQDEDEDELSSDYIQLTSIQFHKVSKEAVAAEKPLEEDDSSSNVAAAEKKYVTRPATIVGICASCTDPETGDLLHPGLLLAQLLRPCEAASKIFAINKLVTRSPSTKAMRTMAGVQNVNRSTVQEQLRKRGDDRMESIREAIEAAKEELKS